MTNLIGYSYFLTVLCVSWNYNLKKIHLHLHGTLHLEYQDGGDDFQVLDMRDADSFTSAIKTENRITLPKVDLGNSKDYIDIKRGKIAKTNIKGKS